MWASRHPGQARFAFSGEPAKAGHQAVHRAMKSRMRGAAVNIAAGKREPGADGKLMGRTGGTAENDFRGKNVSRKAGQRGDFYPHKFAECVADVEMMGCDMERYGFHDFVSAKLRAR